MSKLYDLLNSLIGKVNKSIKTDAQTLTEDQKSQARANIGAAAVGETGGGGGGTVSGDAVLYTEQTLTDEQKAQARSNIGAVDSFNDLKDLPFSKSDTVTWDGVPSASDQGVDFEDASYMYHCVVDNVITENECAPGHSQLLGFHARWSSP